MNIKTEIKMSKEDKEYFGLLVMGLTELFVPKPKNKKTDKLFADSLSEFTEFIYNLGFRDGMKMWEGIGG